ncbi:MAG: hypothetical protein MZV70_49935 [Desulfobacterales bacterium]|nr:hypothetical protein [Desulfobacterales bacterium]
MNDHLISLYIDDELDLDDKIVFVETVHDDKTFKDDAVTCSGRKSSSASEVVDHLPALQHQGAAAAPGSVRLFRPLAAARRRAGGCGGRLVGVLAVAGAAAAALSVRDLSAGRAAGRACR